MIAGGPAWAKKIMISRGMARKNSTTAPAGTLIHLCSDSRPRPKTMPKTSANTAATPAAFSVPPRPGMICLVQTSFCVKGFHSLPENCFSWLSRAISR